MTNSVQESLYTLENMDKEGVRDVLDYSLDQDGVLGDEKHPIVGVLRANPDLFHVDVDKNKRWIRLERVLVRACCAKIRETCDSGVSSSASST